MAGDVYEISMLLDFYGQLLTDSQFKAMDMHYNQDLSLSEIAEELEISRQGVHDFIKRGRAVLSDYENKLGLMVRFCDIRNNLKVIQEDLQLIDKAGLSSGNLYMLDQIEKNLVSVITKI